MIRIVHIVAGGCLLVCSAATAGAQQGETGGTRASSLREQERLFERVQRSNKRASASICEAGCRGEMRDGTQPKDPFAKLPDHTDQE